MRKLIISVATAALTIGLLSACSNKDVGTVGGAALGGVAGNALTGGSTAGTIVGAVGGGYVGRKLSE